MNYNSNYWTLCQLVSTMRIAAHLFACSDENETVVFLYAFCIYCRLVSACVKCALLATDILLDLE